MVASPPAAQARGLLLSVGVLVGAAACSSCCPKQLPGPSLAPAGFVEVAPGDGKLVSASFGAPGGRLTLGPGLPSLLVPAGALDDTGRMLALRAVTPPGADLPQGTTRSPIFQLNPPTEARLEHAFVVSTPLAEPEGGCPLDGLRLAVERPVDMGPGTPTLRWDYEPTTVIGRTATASLVRIYGHRLEFICLGGGSP